MEKKNKFLLILGLLAGGFIIRASLFTYGLVGDINAAAEWGMKFWQIGASNFYTSEGWYYSFPTQPPLANLIFSWTRLISEQNIFAQLHNLLKVVPSSLVSFMGSVVPQDPLMHTFE